MKRKGFTLVEILIVVIILGILAAIVIPQFTEASSEARVSNLMTNLQTIRSQLLLYKTQHLESYPTDDASGHTFVEQMTQYSDQSGDVSATPSADFPFGPYLQSIPVNPISSDNTVTVVNDADVSFSAPDDDAGWWFNAATGEFRANLTDAHTTSDGTTQLNEL
jgi:general secretion pathway protein G